MRMTRPKQAYAAIWSQLSGDKRTADHASELLEEHFESRRIKQPILMLVDELDQLMTRKQDVLYRYNLNLFHHKFFTKIFGRSFKVSFFFMSKNSLKSVFCSIFVKSYEN